MKNIFSTTQSSSGAKQEPGQISLVRSHLEAEDQDLRWHYQRKICITIALMSALVSAIYSSVLWLWFFSGWGALFDLLFVFLHLTTLFLIRSEPYTKAAYWAIGMVMLQIAIGVILFVGPETGFQYYLICLPGVVYLILLREPAWRKLGVVLIGCAIFYLVEHVTVSSLRVNFSEDVRDLMYYGNLGIVLIINYYSVKFFVDEAQTSAREQKRLLLSDSLTGLCNRRYILEFAHKLLALCKRYQHPISLIMLDIDHFKNINDRFGHHAGDDALLQVANSLRKRLRESDVAARYGGEEFLILMPETDLLKAEEIAERIRKDLAETALLLGGEQVNLTASFGVSCSDLSATGSAEQLIRLADSALYRAKRAGRNCVKLAYSTEELAD